jgi:hypothetical protein
MIISKKLALKKIAAGTAEIIGTCTDTDARGNVVVYQVLNDVEWQRTHHFVA